jgi:cytochrome c oxidase accessory protein FixG
MQPEELLKPVGFRDTASTITGDGKRKWIYVDKTSGKFYHAREIASWFYLLLFFSLPFIKVNGMPFLMINIPEGRFIIFSKIFWPQDFFIFAVAMITFIVFIILFTVVFGRLFCGWACPQTVFMEFVFRRIEWWIEGSPAQQRKRNEGPWTNEKIIRKVAKHIIFFLLSFLIANVFLAYILGSDTLFQIIKEPVSEHIVLLSGLLFFTLLFYAVFAFVRDIVCTTICPYGRLQGVMFDKDTMQISYDYKRGEPRGKFKRNSERNLGDCIDCKRCIQVCPTGIDIRNGVQLDCIGCAACVDACNIVMKQVNLPKGLIRYASENKISQGTHFRFNGRMKAYSVLLLLMVAFMSVLLLSRKSIDADITRASGQLYQVVNQNKISNLFTARIINKTNKDVPIRLVLVTSGGSLKIIGHDSLLISKEAINEFSLIVEFPEKLLTRRSQPIQIDVFSGNEKIQTIQTTFLGPFI